jgi:iron complex outermembrane receptor protein
MLAGAALAAAPAMAQQAGSEVSSNDDAVGDIVVTAQKRSESLQNVPLAITALSGDSLVDRNINDMTGLAASVPNMTFGSYGGAARISIRGIGYDNIGQGQEGRIAYHLDGVYISRPADVLGTFYDVERVEVLRGPQGTLYGRNATGGSINVITRAPTDDWRGYVRVGYGNYNAFTSEGALGGPIAPGARFRIAYTVEDRDGYGRNLTTGNDIDNARRGGVRGALSLDLGASGKLDLSADYYREKDANYGYKYLGAANPAIPAAGFRFGGSVPANIRDIATDFDPVNDRESYGFSARAEFDLGGVTLKSISAYRHSDFSLKAGADGTSATLAEINYFTKGARQYSQELQLSGDVGPLRYILGAYYFDEKVTGGSVIPLNQQLVGGPDRLVQGLANLGTIHKKAAAAFGQLDYDFSDQFTLTLGGRYSWERYSVNDFTSFNLAVPYPPFVNLMVPTLHVGGNSATDKSFTPKVQLSYKPRPGMMVYASASKGFKSGGFDIGTTAPAFEPETLWAYEGGMKGTFADGRVRINVAGFYYDYTNIQVTKVLFSVVRIENAAASVIYGGEAELTLVPFDGLQLDVTPAWLHSKYKNYITENPSRPGEPVANQDRSGNQLIQAPEMSLQVGAEYGWDMARGRVKLRGEMKFQDRIYFTQFNEKQVSRAPNTKYNAFLNYEGNHWDASLYVLNLTNRTTFANALASGIIFGAPVLGTLDPPRTYGVKVGYRF